MLSLTNSPPLYGILDIETCLYHGINYKQFIKAFFDGGGSILQYRNKIDDENKIYSHLTSIIPLVENYKGILIVNDFYQIALKLNLNFHLGQEDYLQLKSNHTTYLWYTEKLKEAKVLWGLSTHSIKEIQNISQEKFKPNYIGFGSIFPSTTKPSLNTKQHLIRKALSAWKNDIVLIGGISLDNIHRLPKGRNIYYAIINDFFRYGSQPIHITHYTKNFFTTL